MLRPEEVEMLVCGNPTLNMAELKKVTVYDGYSSRDPTIKYELLLIVHLLGSFVVIASPEVSRYGRFKVYTALHQNKNKNLACYMSVLRS